MLSHLVITCSLLSIFSLFSNHGTATAAIFSLKFCSTIDLFEKGAIWQQRFHFNGKTTPAVLSNQSSKGSSYRLEYIWGCLQGTRPWYRHHCKPTIAHILPLPNIQTTVWCGERLNWVGVKCVESSTWSYGSTMAMYPRDSHRLTLAYNLNSMERTA